MFPKGLSARLYKAWWQVPSIFYWLQNKGSIEDEEMYRTFNMGLGMVMCLEADKARALCSQRQDCWIIGEVIAGDDFVLEE